MSMSDGLQPGGFAHGPDEKWGRAGNVVGFGRRNCAPAVAVSVNSTLLAESTRRVGTAWPVAGFSDECGLCKAAGILLLCGAQQPDSHAFRPQDYP